MANINVKYDHDLEFAEEPVNLAETMETVPAESIVVSQNIINASDLLKELTSDLKNPFKDSRFLKILANIFISLEKLVDTSNELRILVDEAKEQMMRRYEESS